MKHRRVEYRELLKNFPHSKVRESQKRALKEMEGSVVMELPTGTGKTALGYTYLKTLRQMNRGEGTYFYVTPSQTLVRQVKELHPDFSVVYGRDKYPCPYYSGKYSAADVPCSFLDCEYQEGGCPYYDAKRDAIASGMVVCTTAYFAFQNLFVRNSRARDKFAEPFHAVLDEVHRTADVLRACLSNDITDYHLKKCVSALKGVDESVRGALEDTLRYLKRIVSVKASKELLSDDEIRGLMGILERVDSDDLRRKVNEAIEEGTLDEREDREALRILEELTHSIPHKLTSMEYCLGTDPLNYVYAYLNKSPGAKAKYTLRINNFYVAPLIRNLLLPQGVAYSATVGDESAFRAEVGLGFPVHAQDSEFPVGNTRVFLPTDTPNLAVKARAKGDVGRTIETMLDASGTFVSRGHRCLIEVVSEKERLLVLNRGEKKGLHMMSYGNGVEAKDAAMRFREGEGDVLVGTVANYREGLDLPRETAPVIFFLRPSYPPPDDPQAAFETRRFGRERWKRWNWRASVEALQVRGRNIRSAEDLGVTFFMSQQFKRALKLPRWLEEAKREKSFSTCVIETLEVLAHQRHSSDTGKRRRSRRKSRHGRHRMKQRPYGARRLRKNTRIKRIRRRYGW